METLAESFLLSLLVKGLFAMTYQNLHEYCAQMLQVLSSASGCRA